MRTLINNLMDAAKKYTFWDYAFFKTCLIAVGIILGAYFSQFFLKYISIVWIIAIAAYVWVIYKTLIKYRV